ncbi:MAG: hypothetical protein HY392_01120 [Candidatus Diapherotrites archaeon]|nr:hypothetical protein [Candidatus Diapherotrites archaeon]
MAKKTISALKATQNFLETIGGPYAPEIVKIYEKKNKAITDEDIEKKTKLKITEIRTILNRLHYRGIAEYQKKRNEKTGWYIYSWEIKIARIAQLLTTELEEQAKKLENQISFESGYTFFKCKKKCAPLVFEIAAEYQFRCPQCGQVMAQSDNTESLEEIKKTAKETSKTLEELKKMWAETKK